MNYKLFRLFFFCFLMAFVKGYSQKQGQQKIDSLLLLINSDKEDTTKVNHLNQVAYLYRNNKPDSTIAISKQSIAICEKTIQTSPLKLWFGYSDAVGNLGIGYRLKGDYPKAKEYYFKALKMDEELGNKFGIGKRLVGIANLYLNLANYPKALEYGFKALKANEEINNKRAIALSVSTIGQVYSKQQDYKLALQYSFNTLKTFEEINDKNNTQATYLEIGAIYQKLKNYSKALEYLFIALKMSEDFGLVQLNAETLSNIGSVYLEQKEYKQALEYYNKALVIDKRQDIVSGIANDYNNIGYILTVQEKYIEAEEYLSEAIKMAKQTGALINQMQAENNLYTLYEKWNKPSKALEHYIVATNLKDSIFNKTNTQKLMNMEFDRKEEAAKAEQDKKDAVAIAESKKQKFILFLVALGLLSVVVFAGFVVRSLRITNKQNKIIAQHQLEITDSITYAQRIQYSLLARKEILNSNLNEHFILYMPKDIVSGDFYWCAKKEDSFYFAVCDSTGHGVPGAFMSLLNINFMNEAVIEKNIAEPNKIFDYVKNKLIETTEGGNDGMDATLLRFEKNKITYCAAYHKPILISDNQLTELQSDKMAVGKGEKNEPFTLHEIQANKGDTLYLFSDGYADQFSPKDKKLMSKKFKELLLSSCHLPMNEQKSHLEAFIKNWKGTMEQTDDILVIGIKT